MRLQKIYVTAAFLICIFSAKAQTKDSILEAIKDLMIDSKPPKSYFKAQISYLSNAVFNGRKDTIALPYIMPSIEYNHKSGLYLNATLSYLSNKQSRIDVFDLTGGYNFENKTETLFGSIYANKSFYNESSNNVQSDIKGNIGGFISYATSFLTFYTGTNLMFASTTDFNLNVGIEKLFYLDKDETWTINPNITANLSGTGFYQSFSSMRRNRSNQLVNTKLEISSPNKFQIMSYDIALPLSFENEKWGFFVTPYYTIAQNPVTTTYQLRGPNGMLIPSSVRNFEEKVENSFFAEMGIYIKF